MNAEGKKTPQGVPPIFQELNEQVRQGAAAPEAAENVYVRMLIDGGEHGERYHFHFVASGRGEVEAGIRCDLSDREYETQTAELQQEDWAKLLQSLNIPALIESRQLNVHIPPGSLVGRLEISNSEQTVSTVFMADPGQAETADYEMPPMLAQTVETIYDLAAKQLDTQDIRP